jgi:hypothetical protein
MKKNILFLIVMISGLAFGQAQFPNDTLKIGQGSTSNDKSIIFDTDDGGSNKKLSVEKTSKLLKYDGNSLSLGDNLGSDKTLTFDLPTDETFKWNNTTSLFELSDDLTATGTVKAASFGTTGTEVVLNSKARAENGIVLGASPANNGFRVSGGVLQWSQDGSSWKNFTDQYVGLTGNESVAGVKTFTDRITVSSSTQGSRPCPSMSTTSMNNIASPNNGDCVFNSSTNAVHIYDTGVWFRQIHDTELNSPDTVVVVHATNLLAGDACFDGDADQFVSWEEEVHDPLDILNGENLTVPAASDNKIWCFNATLEVSAEADNTPYWLELQEDGSLTRRGATTISNLAIEPTTTVQLMACRNVDTGDVYRVKGVTTSTSGKDCGTAGSRNNLTVFQIGAGNL